MEKSPPLFIFYAMDDLFKMFNQKFLGVAKLMIIGGEVRSILARRHNWSFPDLTTCPHLDVLIELPSAAKVGLVDEILNYFQARPLTDLCFAAEINNLKLEFVGVVINKQLFTIKMKPFLNRPDLTIERFGYYSDGLLYDESGRGWGDFYSRKIVLMHNSLFLRKYLKILSLKFQTGFDFDTNTAKQISLFEEGLIIPRKRQNHDFIYNRQLSKTYGLYDQRDNYQVGIHAALLYLRANNYSEVTDYIESRDRLKTYLAQAGVDYHYFEIQARNESF